MNSARKVTLGETVTFTAEAAELLGRDRLTIYEITDSRHLGGGVYGFALTPVTMPPTLNAAYRDVWAEDLQLVG